ncbi:MAG TPA: NAD(P)H-dependent oxidoreductase [Candidatus Dojkabacteria bacterium]|jgi:NAD(P)H-dependent FMN reductase
MLKIPIIQGTSRKRRESIKVSNFIVDIGKTIEGIEVFLVDPQDMNLPYDGNDEDAKDPKYTKITKEADAFFIVTPEYNHSFPGSLKRLLDSELNNYIHKPVAFAGVSDGLWGGVRAIEALVVTTREMGMTATFSDVLFPKVIELFDDEGKIIDKKYIERVQRTYKELIWMAKALKWGRENL